MDKVSSQEDNLTGELKGIIEDLRNALQYTREALQTSYNTGMMMENRYSNQKRVLEGELAICQQEKQKLETIIVKEMLKSKRVKRNQALQMSSLQEELKAAKEENVYLKKQLKKERNKKVQKTQEV